MNSLPSEPNIQTFRASSLHEALQLVRQALGPDAAVLDVKQGQNSRLFGLVRGDSFVEVTASNEINVPSRLKQRSDEELDSRNSFAGAATDSNVPAADRTGPGVGHSGRFSPGLNSGSMVSPHARLDGVVSPFASSGSGVPPRTAISDYSLDDARYSAETLAHVQPSAPASINRFGPQAGGFNGATGGDSASPWGAMLQSLQQRRYNGVENWTPALFKTYNDLIDADMSESVAKDLLFQVGSRLRGAQANHLPTIQSLLLDQIASEIPVTGPIVPKHRGHLVALVGPTGVGKTTTIAKLAAHYCLNEHRRVGLITVDTYRIAAVEQLRVYANIIDLPMLVVRNLAEMRQAVNRMRNLDLILMDTAGRGAREELKIQELRTFIDEAKADEVQLVLSGTAASRSLCLAAQTFAQTGITSLIMTKLDEVLGLGNLLPLLRSCNLPLSYITNGQSVPEDFEVAEPGALAQMALGHMDVLKRSDSLVRVGNNRVDG